MSTIIELNAMADSMSYTENYARVQSEILTNQDEDGWVYRPCEVAPTKWKIECIDENGYSLGFV